MSETISTVLSFVSLVMLFFAPVGLLLYARSYRKNLAEMEPEKAAKNPNAQFFVDYKVDKYSQAYVVIFFVRRYVMVLLLTLDPMSSNTLIFG